MSKVWLKAISGKLIYSRDTFFSVSVPCEKSLSDSGFCSIAVDKKNIYANYKPVFKNDSRIKPLDENSTYDICLGDSDAKRKTSVRTGENEYKAVHLSNASIVATNHRQREEYAKRKQAELKNKAKEDVKRMSAAFDGATHNFSSYGERVKDVNKTDGLYSKKKNGKTKLTDESYIKIERKSELGDNNVDKIASLPKTTVPKRDTEAGHMSKSPYRSNAARELDIQNSYLANKNICERLAQRYDVYKKKIKKHHLPVPSMSMAPHTLEDIAKTTKSLLEKSKRYRHKANAYSKYIHSCREVLKEYGYINEVSASSDDDLKPISERNPIDAFNHIRGINVEDVSQKRFHTNGNKTYVASFDSYGFSEKELSLLDNNDYIILSDIPVKNSRGNIDYYTHYLCRLEPLDVDAKATHYLFAQEIDILDERFADEVHNERYHYNKSNYDRTIQALAVGKATSIYSKSKISKGKEFTEEDVYKTRAPRSKEQPVRRMKAMKTQGVAYNSYDRLQAAYVALRQQEPSEYGKKLGFETAYDEKRFMSDKSYLKTYMDRLQNALEYHRNANIEASVDSLESALAYNKSLFEELNEQEALRQVEPSPEAAERGCKSAYEERIMNKYDELIASSYEHDENTKKILWQMQRLQDAIDIRRDGFEAYAESVSKGEDRYSELGVYLPDIDTVDTDVPDFI